MKALAVGAAGKMGRAVVSYLADDPQTETIGMLDIREDLLEGMKKGDRSGKLQSFRLDLKDPAGLKALMKKFDVAVVTLPTRDLSYKVMEAAVEAGLNLVDVLEEYHRRPDKDQTEGFQVPAGYGSFEEYGEALHRKAEENGVLVLDGMGFAPGLSNITTAQGIRKLDRVETAVARVGGIPNVQCCAHHPLRYMTTWSLEHVLREYSIKTQILKDGRITEVQALYDEERFRFDELGIDEELECAVTPGMPSFIHTHPGLKFFAEKTVRWPGHYQGVRTLIECGLFDEKPVEIEGVTLSPRRFLLGVINPLLIPQPGDGDVCVMYNTVRGEKDGKPCRIEYYMWEESTEAFSAMARVTSFPAAIGARLVASGRIGLKGIRAPEECVLGADYDWFLEQLKARQITIKERIS